MFTHFKKVVLDFLFPPRCPWCKAVGTLPVDHSICNSCVSDIHWSPGEWRSSKVPNHCDSIHAVALFQGRLRDAVHQLKYDAKPFLAKSCAEIMVPIARGLPECDVVMAVPLSRQRLKKRRYNQAEWLARHIAAVLALPQMSDAVARTHANTPQVGLGAEERWDNVRCQFEISADNSDLIQGKRVLIVDDVVTTGATLQALAQTLKKSGALTVRALTLGQTV